MPAHTYYYDADTYKRHAKKPSYGMDLGAGRKRTAATDVYTAPKMAASYAGPTTARQAAAGREVDMTFATDAFGHVF